MKGVSDSQEVRIALWKGVRKFGRRWRDIQESCSCLRDIPPASLAHYAKKLGLVDASSGKAAEWTKRSITAREEENVQDAVEPRYED